jgi:hypothetical protein
LCPIPFVVLGARGEPQLALYLRQLAPFLVGNVFLLWRYLSRPRRSDVRRIPLLVAEVVSWLVVARLLVLVSEVNLLVGFERFGASCTNLLLMTALSTPLVLWRRTALELRLSRLPRTAAIAILVLLLLTSTAAAIAHFLMPARFI